MPGLRVPFHPMAFPGVAIPTSRWNVGYSFIWTWRHTCKCAFVPHSVIDFPRPF